MRFAGVCALALASCATLGWIAPKPYVTGHPTPMVVPSLQRYQAIWATAEACTHTHGDLTRVRWQTMPGNYFSTKDGPAIGAWESPHTITIAVDWLTTDWVLKHEMIHDLLQQGHTPVELSVIWGHFCQATWGYQPRDPTYRP